MPIPSFLPLNFTQGIFELENGGGLFGQLSDHRSIGDIVKHSISA